MVKPRTSSSGLMSGLCLTIGLLALLVLSGVYPASAETGRRVALVIGNAGYLHVGVLRNPVNDASAMAKLFTDAGFDAVEAKTDLDGKAFRRTLADFEVMARGADVAIVYYSGHGVEFGGQNFLMPVDAAVERDVDVKDETVPLDRVLQAVQGATRLKLVLLDACRTDPFKATSQSRAINRGLQSIEPSAANELVAYAAKAGTVAADGEPGGNSPYTTALLKRLTTPGLDVELALRRVHDDVLATTRREQEPFYYGAMGGDEVSLVAPAGVARPETPGVERVVAQDPAHPPVVAPVATVSIVAVPAFAPTASMADPAVAECDRLAASPYDMTRRAGLPGVRWRQIDARRAVPACTAACAHIPAIHVSCFSLAEPWTMASGRHARSSIFITAAPGPDSRPRWIVSGKSTGTVAG